MDIVPRNNIPGTQFLGTNIPVTKSPGTKFLGTKIPVDASSKLSGTKVPGTNVSGTNYWIPKVADELLGPKFPHAASTDLYRTRYYVIYFTQGANYNTKYVSI